MATTTTEFDPGPHKVEKADSPKSKQENRFGSRRSMLNNEATDAQYPYSKERLRRLHATQEDLEKFNRTKSKTMIKVAEAQVAMLMESIWVVLNDEFGSYATTIDRLDSGNSDPRRWATSRLGKLLGKEAA